MARMPLVEETNAGKIRNFLILFNDTFSGLVYNWGLTVSKKNI